MRFLHVAAAALRPPRRPNHPHAHGFAGDLAAGRDDGAMRCSSALMPAWSTSRVTMDPKGVLVQA